MENESLIKVQNKLLTNKESRRRALVKAPIEEKIKMLVQLQRLTSNIDKEVGRPYRKPWDIKTD